MEQPFIEKRISMNEIDDLKALFGNFDENIKIIEDKYPVHIVYRQGEVVIIGAEEHVKFVEQLLYRLMQILRSGELLDSQIHMRSGC